MISNIDKSRQYYVLHVPSSYTKSKEMPLAIIIPAILGARVPYLESFRLCNIFLINRLQVLAEKYNVIIVQPGSRRHLQPNLNLIEDSELFDILYDIEKDYNIDRSRLYLLGACGAGNDALEIASRNPDKFAALGIIAPEILFPNETGRSVIPYIRNLINVPVHVTHSLIDSNTPVERSRLLTQIANDVGFKNFRYEELTNEFPLFYSDDFFDEAIEFAMSFTRDDSPTEIDFSTSSMRSNKSAWITINEFDNRHRGRINARLKRSNTVEVTSENILSYTIDLDKLPFDKKRRLRVIENGNLVFEGVKSGGQLVIGEKPAGMVKTSHVAGPFSNIFAGRFIIAKGTRGCEIEDEIIDSIANRLNELWYHRYFTSPLLKKDFEITADDIQESNLLLLGNFDSNHMLNDLRGELPVTVNIDEIQFFGERVKGRGLNFYFIYPNPRNPLRYVGIIGYNDIHTFGLGSENDTLDDISNYGWYDYKVWDARQRVILSGEFNSRWKIH